MRKLLQSASFILALTLPAAASPAGNNWMGSIGGTVRLSQISIPGTHDSGARVEQFPGTAKCQNATIAEQLGYGVRFLDIRCKHVNDAFDIYHGTVNQNLTFSEVLNQVTGFLTVNPGECVMMSIKEETSSSGTTRSFEATFDSYVAANPAKWSLATSVPDLGGVRGKILLVRRFGATVAKGINATNWPDNTTFNVNNLSVQDWYQATDNAIKWTYVTAAFTAAFSDTNANVLHLNFTSGYKSGLFGIPSITTVSNSINPQLATYFGTAPHGHYGCILMDFADATRPALIYNTNFITADFTTAYWDLNGSTTGAGGATPTAVWDAAGADWNTVADGSGVPAAWVPGQMAVFAAGTDASGIYSVTVDGTKDISGLTFEEGMVTITGGPDLRLVANSTITVNPGLTATVAVPISQDSPPRSLTKNGTGTLILSSANTYTGTTTVNAGTLALGNVDALSTTTGLTLANGTQLRSTLNGAVVNAPITIGTNATISAPTNNPGDQTPTVLTLGGPIGGGGNVTFTSSVNANTVNTVLLNARSTYAGSTLLDTSGTSATQIIVKLGTHNALPTATVVTIDGRDGTDSGRRAEIDLNGFNQEIAGLTNVARNLRWQRILNSDTAPAATLTVNNGSNHTFSGRLGHGGANFGLTKSGSGVLTLTGTLEYAGDTTATGGTLALGSTNAGNDLSTVTIAASGTKLQLNFAGTDTVARLFIGTTQQVAGVYGHSASGATNGGLGVGAMDAYFEPGTGTLTVKGDYLSWAATNAPTTTPDEDEDGDGMSNAVEYVLGGHRDINDLDKLPKVSTTGGNIVFSFEREQASIDGTTAVAIEVGTTLAAWPVSYPVPDEAANGSPGVAVAKDHPMSGKDTVTLTLPQASDAKKFVRLKVTIP